MTLALDRVEIEGAGSDPRRLASALLKQLTDTSSRIPIHEIARALDIVAIGAAPLRSIEGCLQCDALRSEGQIIVNSASSAQRQRYTVAHELGHFLNEKHSPTTEVGFACTADDLGLPRRSGRDLIQEQEANTFAIEVLTPRNSLAPFLRKAADLDHALALAERFDISREAAARRYVALHQERLAVVFSKEGRVRYVEKGADFPATTMWTGDTLGHLHARDRDVGELTTLDEADPADWLKRPRGWAVFAQMLFQTNGYATTLLVAERDERVEETLNW
ncbi:MAG: ImmA/IrrE family metallo-endopeptidase [Rhodobiaceae bacterium]|nr:ImmA/IrrE family metallo-endopeptidase [Rhodobiaceae bacterium]MCC0068192.1 ImmA/IrrE family metallo-endopeptidase [Rhodovulum sp.]